MFNSLNSTGMPLSDADIISAKLYSKCQNDREQFMDNWKNLKEKCEELSQKKIVDIDNILQQYMYINRAVNKEYARNQITTPGIRKYYTYEKEEILNRPLEISENFNKITDIWDNIRNYSEIKILLKFNENFKLFLISYLYRFDVDDINKSNVIPISLLLLRLLAILEISDIGYSSAKFKTFLFNENLKLVDKSVPLSEIEADFNNHINTTWNRDNLKSNIMEYEKNVLVYLNDYLYALSHGENFDLPENVNIEHIMPSSGHNINTIRLDAGIEDIDEFKKTVNLLGNKILLEEDINKAISNDWFKTKKGGLVKDKKGYIGSKFCLAASLAHYHKDSWEKEDIEVATEKVADRILEFIYAGSIEKETIQSLH